MFVGAAVGAGIALLVSPRSGEENRQMIKDKAHATKDKVQRGKHAMQEAFDKARQEGDELKTKVADSSKRVINSARSEA